MKLDYRWDAALISIEEKVDGKDYEFRIRLLQAPNVEAMRKVQHLFESNDVYTDVLFYAYPEHEYRVIVRQDFYADFILALMHHQLLRSVEWK